MVTELGSRVVSDALAENTGDWCAVAILRNRAHQATKQGLVGRLVLDALGDRYRVVGWEPKPKVGKVERYLALSLDKPNEKTGLPGRWYVPPSSFVEVVG